MAAAAPRRATGGKAVCGARLGILMLESRVPRIPGDIGNALTWPFPVLYRVVRGASPEAVVLRRAEGLLDAFVAAGEDLVRDGADGITTSCGFLSLFQRELADRLGVPVAASSLMQVPMVERLLPPGRRVGIVTISAATLSADHLRAAGVATDTPIGGTAADGEFARVFLGGATGMDVAAAEADVVAAGRALVAEHPAVGALVLECTNMAPHAGALAEAVGMPVFDIHAFITWFHAGLAPRRWEA